MRLCVYGKVFSTDPFNISLTLNPDNIYESLLDI